MRTVKRMLTVVIFTVCAVLCASWTSARTVLGSGSCGNQLTWTMYDDGELTIEGKGDMFYWQFQQYVPWYPYRNSIETVTIGKGVNSIGYNAFSSYSKLKNLNLSDTVTSIGRQAFYWCVNLKNVTFPDSLTYIAEQAFYNCSSFTEVKIPDSVTSMNYSAFGQCANVKSVTIGQGLTSLGNGVFSGMSALKYVVIPANIKTVDYAFISCDRLSGVAVNGRDTEFIINNYGEDPFYLCSDALTLFGYTGSSAHTFAAERGYRFVALDGTPSVGDTTVEETTKSTEFTIKVVDQAFGTPISGAYVVLGGIGKATDSAGNAVFTKLASASAPLAVNAAGYHAAAIPNYAAYRSSGNDVILLAPEGVTELLPMTCNGESISTSYAQINNRAPLKAEIVVNGQSPAGIEYYELRQGGVILQRNMTGEFSVPNSSFKKGIPVTAYMKTKDGKSLLKELNIRVVSFSLTAEAFTIGDGKLRIPDDFALLGGIELEIDALEKFPEYEVTNTEIKVGYNQTVKEKDLSKLNAGLRKWMTEHNRKTPSSKLSFDVGGYIIVSVNHEGVQTATGEVIFAANYSNGFNKTIPIFSVPVNIDVRFTLGGEVVVEKFGYDFANAKILLPAVDGTIKGGITAKAGVGIEAISAGVYGSLTLKLTLDILPEFAVDSLTANGEIGVYAKVILLGEKKLPLLGGDGDWILYDKDKAAEVSALQALAGEVYDAGGYTVSEREYLEYRSDWYPTSYGLLQYSSYNNAAPMIVSADDVTLMVYVDDNGSADNYNYQELVYSVYTPDGWTTPAPVDGNRLNDAEFDLCTDGESIWVVYTEAKRSITAADDITDYAGILEVAAARFDPTSGAFTDRTVLTDNETMDRLPAIAIIDGIPTAVWVENGDNNLFGMGENNTLNMSTYTDGAWTTPLAAAEVPAVVDLDVGELEGLLTTALVLDSNSNFATPGDSILTLYTSDGASAAWEAGEYGSVRFEDDTLYWYSAGSLYSTTAVSGTGELVSDALTTDGASDFELITVDGVKHILYRLYYTEYETGGSDIYVIKETDGGWTLPVRLTNTYGYVDSFSAMAQDGNIHVVYRLTDVYFWDNEINATGSLYAETIAPAVALTIDDIAYTPEDLFDDGEITLTVTVTNNGTSTANGFCVSVDENTYTAYESTLEAGTSAETVLTLPVPEKNSALTVTVTDEIGMTKDADVRVSYADFTVSAEARCIGETYYLSTSVSNVGNVSGEGTLFLYRDDAAGDIICMEEISLAAGDQVNILAEVVDNTLTQVYAEFVPSAADYFTEDNYTFFSVMRSSGEAISVRLTGDINNDESVDIDDAMALFRNSMLPEVYPTDYTDNTDFNGDGVVDIRDAQRLFRYSMLPDVYPIG